MFKRHTTSLGTAILMLLAATSTSAQTPLGSEWTYQGQLNLLGEPLNDTADFEFTLWDADTAGNQIGSVRPVNNVTVVDGLFTVELEFGVNAFNTEKRWLEIDVRSPAGGGTLTTLSPRQPLTTIPYALQTLGLVIDNGGNVTGAPGNNNSATGGNATVGGGTSNSATESRSTIGGGQGNTAADYFCTIGGGRYNTIPWDATGANTIGGGEDNTAQGGSSTVAGGAYNTANGMRSTVGGGHENTASGTNSTVAGGGGYLNGSLGNTASGFCSTVPGGARNVADGDYSFAAGNRAKANHNGAFVWADITDEDFASTAADQFLIRASGGVGINKNDPATALDVNGTVTAASFVGDGSGLTGIIAGDPSYGSSVASPDDAVFVANNGSVGIGTTAPNSSLDVAGETRTVGIRLPGGFAPDPNFVGEPGNHISFGGVSEDFIGYKSNTFYFMDCPGGGDTADPDVVIGGDVGIGTTTPEARLGVEGDIRFGTAQEFHAVADTDPTVIVRGLINDDGSVDGASTDGISATRQQQGVYRVTFPASAFSGTPIITVTAKAVDAQDKRIPVIVNQDSVDFVVRFWNINGNLSDSAFNFIAIGPR